ncbi:bifunctional lysylphosphatidylglycerol flippase/synthetase MprF [Nocardioides sp. GY 10127]|uniref:bifunctional lysylphosphatidylglycerol flippase/synthetase MprF n=1 Tax=Nocardioides sp. GY 10127 TaxID=2569762 RepID=UPI0010A9054A|nr:bifunctional lysylphosphatidylglycerol flippase/synthetase MprF [Nocardioides sp. GY 10127]TIC84470.1 bifunctional lysylphosphatidylglycerol flippase/synthetase MprF [Nocardioides sp. GY 10127]
MNTLQILSSRPVRRVLAPLGVLGVLALALTFLHRSMGGYDWHRLPADLSDIGVGHVAAALAATALSYLAMTGYDALALRYVADLVPDRLPWRRYASASLVATAFGNSLGASAIVGAALRARVYSAWQIPAAAIQRIIGFNLLTLGLGFAVLAGGGVLFQPGRAAQALHLPEPVVTGLAVTVLAPVLGYLAWSRLGRRPLVVKGHELRKPGYRLALAQVALSTVEVALMAAALWFLLPPSLALGAGVGFVAFVAAFAIATVAGLVSNVPGGVGVFESVLVVLLSTSIDPLALAPALVAFRVVYFLVPLLVAAVLLVGLEARRGRDVETGASRSQTVELVGVLTPSVLALLVAGLGVVLVATGEVPWLVSLPAGSAFSVSLVGVALLLLARGLHRRLREAWVVTRALLLGQVALCLVLDATVPGLAGLALLALLAPARGVFHRRSGSFHHPRGLSWTAAAVGLVAVALYAHQRADWGNDGTVLLSIGAEHPFSVRLAALLGTLGVVALGVRLLRPLVPGPRTTRCPDELAKAEQIVSTRGRATSHLAFTGDKRLLFSADGASFLMYQVEGRSWITMGAPVGDPGTFPDLLRDFVRLAERHDGRPVLYSVGEEHADLYRELGMTLTKLGEEAVVDLTTFAMTGKRYAKMRRWVNINVTAGSEVEILAPEQVTDALMAEMRQVSDEWLAERNAKEKRFSLGPFDEEYVRRFPVATVRFEGRLLAFATLWIGQEDGSLAVDLMRQRSGGPANVMNFLFVRLMQWGQEQGMRTFSLGMAPLAGLATGEGASVWDRLGALVFTRGEKYYNFQGVRHFKDCFHPTWESRYVVTRPGLAFPTAMVNVATLVGGGVRGLVSR